jgi:hypothetical protein
MYFCRNHIARTGRAQKAAANENVYFAETDEITVDVIREGASSETTDCAELTGGTDVTAGDTDPKMAKV